MSDLLEFLTSKEIIVIYLLAGIALFVCVIVYFIETHNRKSKLRHNTRELNKLVEEIQEEYPIDQNQVIYQEPVLEVIQNEKEQSNIEELLEKTMELEKIKIDTKIENEVIEKNNVMDNNSIEEPVIIEKLDDLVYEEESIENEDIEELEYTSIEPDQATAQLELKKLTEELIKQEEELSQQDVVSNYEEMQEENAIISMDELLKRGKELYETNEVTQYKDEGNEPISLQELEEKTGVIPVVTEGNFNIHELIPSVKENVNNVVEENKKENIQEKASVKLYDFNSAPTKDVTSTKFKSSPIISPIYGIEKEVSMQLENTANYEKLDAEIKKTNEFLMTLKELQKNIEH